jgi:NTP pyrophosphatase (non-canonical NTP hydrolase)
MELGELQKAVDQWVNDHGGYWSGFQLLARMVEELGEISGAYQRIEGLRPHKQEVDLPCELGDLLFTLAAFANVNKVDLASAVDSAFSKYNKRDSAAWKSHHRRGAT